MTDFVRLCSNSEYFKLHPGKVAGVEKKTTSLAFPYTIEGTREDVERMFSFLGNNSSIDLLEAEAQAELALLELLGLEGLIGLNDLVVGEINENIAHEIMHEPELIKISKQSLVHISDNHSRE